MPKDGIFKVVASRAAKAEFSRFDKKSIRGQEKREKCHNDKKDLNLLNLVGKTISEI